MSDSNANGFLPHSEKQFLHGDFSRALKLFNSSFVFLDVLCFSPSFCPYFPYGGGEQGALNLVDFKVPHEKISIVLDFQAMVVKNHICHFYFPIYKVSVLITDLEPLSEKMWLADHNVVSLFLRI